MCTSLLHLTNFIYHFPTSVWILQKNHHACVLKQTHGFCVHHGGKMLCSTEVTDDSESV